MLSANDGTVVDLKSSNRSRGELLFCIAAVLFLVSLASISWSFSLHSKESSLDQHFDGAEDDFQSVSSVIYAKNILADAAATAPVPCPPNSQLPPGRSFPHPRCPKPAHFPAHSSCPHRLTSRDRLQGGRLRLQRRILRARRRLQGMPSRQLLPPPAQLQARRRGLRRGPLLPRRVAEQLLRAVPGRVHVRRRVARQGAVHDPWDLLPAGVQEGAVLRRWERRWEAGCG